MSIHIGQHVKNAAAHPAYLSTLSEKEGEMVFREMYLRGFEFPELLERAACVRQPELLFMLLVRMVEADHQIRDLASYLILTPRSFWIPPRRFEPSWLKRLPISALDFQVLYNTNNGQKDFALTNPQHPLFESLDVDPYWIERFHLAFASGDMLTVWRKIQKSNRGFLRTGERNEKKVETLSAYLRHLKRYCCAISEPCLRLHMRDFFRILHARGLLGDIDDLDRNLTMDELVREQQFDPAERFLILRLGTVREMETGKTILSFEAAMARKIARYFHAI